MRWANPDGGAPSGGPAIAGVGHLPEPIQLRQNRAMPTEPEPAAGPVFALAKIQPPRPRTGLVERPGLERSLASAFAHPLTLLLAPAGYGKTAALTRQIRQLPEGTALVWISADADDRLPRFLDCLAAALEPHDPAWRVAPEALATLALAEGGVRQVANEWINALAGARAPGGLIVIDDLHRIADPQVFELLAYVIERVPSTWSFAIASRVEPPWPLARWRATGQLAELRQYDLRFGEGEVASLIAAAGGDPSHAARLLERTEGWAAGLRLSLTARHGSAPMGVFNQRHVFDYLAAEVLDDMPAVLRTFLLRCAVLPELTVARCAQVSGSPDTVRLLEEIERRGLFVSVLDAEELTLRQHDLVRDFLLDRLERDHPEELPGLLCRAAVGEPDLARAVGYFTRAGAWEHAADALAKRGPLLVASGGATLPAMLATLPAAAIDARPDLLVLQGMVAFLAFDFDTTVSAMSRASTGFARAGRAADAALAKAYACIAMQNTGRVHEAAFELTRLRALPLDDASRAVIAFGSAWAAYAELRAEDVAGHFAEMVEALERVPDLQIWNLCFFHSFLTGFPNVNPLMERFADGAFRVAGEHPSHLRAGVLHARVWLALSSGRLDEAAAWMSRADEACHWLGQPCSVATENYNARILIHALLGRRDASEAAAKACLDDMRHAAAQSNRLTHEYEILLVQARARWIFQDAEGLRAVRAEFAAARNPFEWPAAERQARYLDALVALAEERLADALALLGPLAEDVERWCFFPAVQARLMRADVLVRLGDTEAAAASLSPWVATAVHGRELGGALLAGPAVLARLAAVGWGALLPGAAVALLKRLAEMLAPHHAAAPTVGSALSAQATLLSEREHEVLARIAAGDSNKLIARAFDLSPHTVKRHVANILGKLGVETRGQAAAWYRDLR